MHADLLFRFERLRTALVLPRTLQAAFIFKCKTHRLSPTQTSTTAS